VIFLSNLSDFDEKVDFAIKNRVFWPIFWSHFSQILIIFHHFFGSFLGFLGGYPSPSISAPLVVKKCLKLYIYNIGVLTPCYNITISHGHRLNWQTPKWLKMHPLKMTPSFIKNRFRFIRGERELLLRPVYSPRQTKWQNINNTATKTKTEGRTRVYYYISSLWISPTSWTIKADKKKIRFREGRTRV